MAAVVTIEDIERKAGGNVTGKVRLKWEEPIGGNDVQLINVAKDFDISKDGEQEVININGPIGGFDVKAKAKVFEKPGANQVCVQGHLAVKTPIGDIGRDLDENCHPIP